MQCNRPSPCPGPSAPSSTFLSPPTLSLSPSCRYRHTSYQKQTKNQWARDDPAFAVACALLLAGVAAAFCATFASSLWRAALGVASAVVVDFLLLGVAIASACW